MRGTSIQSVILCCVTLFGTPGLAQTGIDTTGTLLVVTNNGTDVWVQTGCAILAVNNQTGASTTLVDNTRLAVGNCSNIYGGALFSPSFSPDGRSICFFASVGGQWGVYTANNDGTGIQKICDAYNNRSGRPSWDANGYIWWSEFTNEIYRVLIATKTREKYWTNCPAEGHDATVVENLTVSVDGTRGESNGNGKVNSLDLVNKVLVAQPVGGCAGAISCDGRYMVIQGTSPATPGSDGAFNGTWLRDFSTGAVVTYVNLVAGAKAFYHSGSRNNSDFFTARSLDGTYQNGAILGRFSTQQSKVLRPASGAWIPSDFWCGPLPSASTTPVISLDKSLLTFTSTGSAPSPQTVAVSNTGAGTLTNVTVTKSAAWLTVTRSGSGNSQTLTNAITVTGLADGTYRDTVRVSGGGAANTASYAVNLTVGSIPAAPSNLVAVCTPGVYSSSVTLTWTDNSANETSFVIERQVGTGSWTQRATAAANATSFADTGLAAGLHTYRVSARNSYGASVASNEAAVTVSLKPQVTLTAPLPPAQFREGDTVYLSWNALNMTSVVLQYSTDDGENFTNMPGLTGQLEPNDPRWNHFPWVVPACPLGRVYLRVVCYTDRGVMDEVGPFTVTQGVGVAGAVPALVHPRLRASTTPLRSVANARTLLRLSGPDAVVQILRLDGTRVGQVQPGAAAVTIVPDHTAAGRYVVQGR